MNDDFLTQLTAYRYIAGVDEAGRGPWAGPVVAAAVILNPERPIAGLADSKKLSEKQRDKLAIIIQQQALSWAIAEASVAEIDTLNILQATFLAMQRAIESLSLPPDYVLIDGNGLPKLTCPAQAIIKGDSKIPAISAASILAKVARDNIMIDYHKQYPQFAFDQHKGYGTRQHSAELQQYGCLAIHRQSFKPIKAILNVT
ncbi:MAG: ribonuclease HII [Methylococcaceae bacterium]